jgi:predicted ferric reductase
MTEHTPSSPNNEVQYSSAGPALAVMVAASFGVLLAVVLAPLFSPTLTATLLGPSPKAYWYLSRATAFVALGLLWLSMVFGLLISDKIARAWPGAQAAFALHEYVSLLGLGFAAFHALVLLGDRYIGYELAQILIPFTAGTYRPFWVGVGQIGLYVWAIISLSFYVKKQIGQPAWKLIHFAAFFNFVVAILHGLTSGTDTAGAWAQFVYWLFSVSVFFLIVYRVASSLMPEDRSARPPVRPSAPPPPPATPITPPSSPASPLPGSPAA